MTKNNKNKLDIQPFEKAFVRRYVLLTITYIKYIFNFKMQLSVTAKSEQGPDLDPHWFDFPFFTLALLSLEKSSCIFWNIKFVDYFPPMFPSQSERDGSLGFPSS